MAKEMWGNRPPEATVSRMGAIVMLWVGAFLWLTSCSPVASTPSATVELTHVPPTPMITASPTLEEDAYAVARQKMVTGTIAARGVESADVLRAMRTVLRHQFVPERYLENAYGDHPLPIGYGQTISQPFIVAWMTELLELAPGDKVLEIGTGSGYQAAVLAELGYAEVYSIEIIPQLAEQAAQRLEALGYTDVHLRQGDGYFGWQEQAPFDAIIVTAAPDHLPLPLVQQLKEGGRLVIPIGPVGGYQTMWQFVRQGEDVTARNLGGVSFVPLVSEGDQPAEP